MPPRRANAPLNQTLAGVRQYLQLNITASKLVLGVPWYGYDYHCLNITHVRRDDDDLGFRAPQLPRH